MPSVQLKLQVLQLIQPQTVVKLLLIKILESHESALAHERAFIIAVRARRTAIWVGLYTFNIYVRVGAPWRVTALYAPWNAMREAHSSASRPYRHVSADMVEASGLLTACLLRAPQGATLLTLIYSKRTTFVKRRNKAATCSS